MLKGRKRRSRKEWAVLVEASGNSKLPVQEFCAKHNISSAGLYKWRSRLKSKSVFVPVKVTSGEAYGATSAFSAALPTTYPAILRPTASQLVSLVSDLESTATPVSASPALISTNLLPEPPSQITSRFILYSGSVKVEFPSGCTSMELQFIAGALSC